MTKRLSPLHAGFALLLPASTVHDQPGDQDLKTIPGAPPGCSFAPRCSMMIADCNTAMPQAVSPSPSRLVRCLRVPAAQPEDA